MKFMFLLLLVAFVAGVLFWYFLPAIPNLKVVLGENRAFDQVLLGGSPIRRQRSTKYCFWVAKSA